MRLEINKHQIMITQQSRQTWMMQDLKMQETYDHMTYDVIHQNKKHGRRYT